MNVWVQSSFVLGEFENLSGLGGTCSAEFQSEEVLGCDPLSTAVTCGDLSHSCLRLCSLTLQSLFVLSALLFVIISDFWWQEAHWRETGGKSETQGAPQWSRSSNSYRKLAGPWTLVLSEVWMLCPEGVWAGLDRATDKFCLNNVFCWHWPNYTALVSVAFLFIFVVGN